MKQFKADVLHWKDYDFTVINDKIEKCYKLIIKFINDNLSNRNNTSYNKKLIKSHVQKIS